MSVYWPHLINGVLLSTAESVWCLFSLQTQCSLITYQIISHPYISYATVLKTDCQKKSQNIGGNIRSQFFFKKNVKYCCAEFIHHECMCAYICFYVCVHSHRMLLSLSMASEPGIGSRNGHQDQGLFLKHTHTQTHKLASLFLW